MTLTLTKKLYLLCGLGFAMVLATGGAALLGSRHINDGTKVMDERSTAVRRAMTCDMMHDALRADVLSALRAGTNADEHKTVVADLTEHVKTFRDDMDENAKLNLGAEVTEATAVT